MSHKNTSLDKIIEDIICNPSPHVDRCSLMALVANEYGSDVVVTTLTRLCETQAMLLYQEKAKATLATAKLSLLLPNQRSKVGADNDLPQQ